MRSIGKWKIKKLRKIFDDVCYEERDNPFVEYIRWQVVRERVNRRIPEEWYDTWECAWSEIDRLIEDMISDYKYSK